MADINITGKGTFAANSFKVPLGQTDVSFHSADDGCKVCFSKYAAFNMASKTLTKGPPIAIPIPTDHPRVGTDFTVVKTGDTCAPAEKYVLATTYTIDMNTSLEHEGHHHQHKDDEE